MSEPDVSNRRGKWPLRRVHKWMSVTVGVVILAWIISGLVMVTPGRSIGADVPPHVDYTAMTISPSQAAHTVSAAHGDAPVQWLNIRRLNDRLTYLVGVRGAPAALVDAGSGAIVTITPEIADAIAHEGLPADVSITSTQRFERPPRGYDGSGPTYVVQMGGGIVAYVNATTGEVARKNGSSRFHEFMGSVHTFRPLRNLPGGRTPQRSVLWVFSLLGIAVALTGYWMALPKRRRAS